MEGVCHHKKIAIFFPCYNEEKRIKIEIFNNIIENNPDIYFYFINDGSTDNTDIILDEITRNKSNAFKVSFSENSGKGHALRRAIFTVDFQLHDYVGFLDVDLEIPFEQMENVRNHLLKTNYEVAISTRKFKNNLIKSYRSLTSLIMVVIANSLIRTRPTFIDTQCGCKLFKASIVETCFKEPFISGWLFDIEIILRLRNEFKNPRRVLCEVPLPKLNRIEEKSTFKFLKNLKLAKELIKINEFYN